MKIGVLSGKGGAGKTTIAVNLAAAAQTAVYIDCDVEEPNGRLFFKPVGEAKTPVYTQLPQFDAAKCTGCRQCLQFCRFHALVYVKDKPMVFPEVCHACGGCQLVCPAGAITETQRQLGFVYTGQHRQVQVVTGVLNEGEASGVPVIRAALRQGFAVGGTVIVDCPPGSACSVTESVANVDYCVLVAEPTAFGFHNFRMVHRLVSLLKKPCGVVINKQESPYEPLEAYCRDQGVPILERIPFSADTARQIARGEIIAEQDSAAAARFTRLLEKIGGAVL